MEYEPVIGLEVHVQLKTRTKVFTRATFGFGDSPNTHIDPVVLGLPGALPVINKEAVRLSARVGIQMGSAIPEVVHWDRKNYFYPDSPKNYQISQLDRPVCVGGLVEIELSNPTRDKEPKFRTVKMERAHLEEDVGKLTHGGADSLVDYNRAGIPLLEIVTKPDIFSSEEALAFLKALGTILQQAGVSDCDMEKGQLRCDANVSLRPKGSDKLGTRTEMKNLNSMTGVRNAIDYEIRRQTRELNAGNAISQETRRWDAEAGTNSRLRGKEESHDYRYFPDPDLLPLRLPSAMVDEWRKGLPELPSDRQRRLLGLGLPYTITSLLAADLPLSNYFEEALAGLPSKPQEIANLVVNDLQRELTAAGLTVSESKLSPRHLAELVKATEEGVISKQMARELLPELFQTGESPAALIERKGLRQNNDDSAIEEACRAAIEADPKSVAQIKGGNDKAINSLKGPVMKAMKGKANPALVDQILRKLLG